MAANTLSAAQLQAVSAYFGNVAFVVPNVTAAFSLDDLEAAASALDQAFNTTLNAAATSVGGTTTIIAALAASLPAPFSSATAAQKTILACHVLMKRVNII